MTDLLPPDLSTLRAFIRGELPPEDHRAVNRWCGRCVDPALLDVLDALIAEWREERLDAAQPSGWFKDLGARFRQMWADGVAQLDAGVQQLALQPLSAPSGLPHIVLLEAEPGLYSVSSECSSIAIAAVLVAIRDHGDPVVLATARAADLMWPSLPTAAWQLDADDGRVTFWLVAHDSLNVAGQVEAVETSGLGGWLDVVIRVPGSEVYAARLGA